MLMIGLVLGLGSCATSAKISDGLVSSYLTCGDGWSSPSLGRQGACSHHGGVVERTVDRRTTQQQVVCHILDTLGLLSLFATALTKWWFDVKSGRISIDGDIAIVPLTIAGETRQVEVVRLNENIYETTQIVALVRCPEGRRKSVFKSKIQFKAEGGQYRQDLTTWICTGRGRVGGYWARAFAWSDKR
jgi:hypothetical protein